MSDTNYSWVHTLQARQAAYGAGDPVPPEPIVYPWGGAGWVPSAIVALTQPVSGTAYQNTQGKTMNVGVTVTAAAGETSALGSLQISPDNVTWTAMDQFTVSGTFAEGWATILKAIVPPDWYYRCNVLGGVAINSATGLA